MAFQFSARSKERVSGVHPTVLSILDRALQISKVDFGIPEYGGLRSAEEQNKLYKKHLSKLDGYQKKSHHQTGKAVDFYAFVDGKASWEEPHLAMVAAAILQASSEIGVKASWGGLWSTNRIVDGIEYGWDCPHIEFEV